MHITRLNNATPPLSIEFTADEVIRLKRLTDFSSTIPNLLLDAGEIDDDDQVLLEQFLERFCIALAEAVR